MRLLPRTAALLVGACVSSAAPLALSQPTVAEVERLQKETAIDVKHLLLESGERSSMSDNFAMRSMLPEKNATAVVRKLECLRAEARKKWLGLGAEKWEHPCDVFVHPDADDYALKTGQSKTTPGHSAIQMDGGTGRILARRIHIHGDAENLMKTVLPHEILHAVLAGNFGLSHVPRWFDEGAAVLDEEGSVARHRQTLPAYHRNGTLFTMRELLAVHDYPGDKRMGAFYAQSATLVDYLAREKQGPLGVTAFVREALKGDPDAALLKHYGKTYDELHTAWEKHALATALVAKMK